MNQATIIAADLLAITILTLGIYFPRHRRRDLVAAYLGVNVGVLAVAGALVNSQAGAGLGLGLFGVLSIIRLRSAELDQIEVAYYFAALALGLLGGLGMASAALTAAMMILVVAVMYVADHPGLLGRYRSEVIHLDRALTDESALQGHLEGLLRATVHRVTVRKVDLVADTTLVEVRYEVPASSQVQATPSVGVLQ